MAADPSAFQTQTHIQALLAAAGLRPQKRHGQHFLIDRNLMMTLIDAAGLTPNDTIIEVGTGTAGLTLLIATRAACVHTFEIDTRIVDVARAQLRRFDNVTIHPHDALAGKNALCDAIRSLLAAPNHRVKLVANLPYDAATPLISELLLVEHPPRCLCFTIQREVGERIMAAPGGRDYGPVSVMCQRFATIERLAILPKSVFWPPPKVESVIMRITPNAAARADDRRRLSRLVRAAFTQRRKTLGHIMAGIAPTGATALAAARIDSRRRPETLSPDEWQVLCDALGDTLIER